MNDFFYNYNFKRFIYLLFGSLCIFYTANLLNFEEEEFSTLFEELNYSLIFMGIGLYLLSHSARVLRLIILNPVSKYSIRSLWKEQYKANGVNLLLPLKLGESYRLIYFKNFFGSYFNSFAVLLCERFLDLLIIFFILSFVLYISSVEVPNLDYVFYGSLTLLGLILFLFFILDELLAIIHKVFLVKTTSSLNNLILELTGNTLKAISRIKEILNRKYLACITISLVIWLLEIAVFFIFFEALEYRLELIVLLAMAVALSSLLPNGPLGLGGVQLAFYSMGSTIGNPEFVNLSIIYSFYIWGSGLVISGILFIYDFFNTDK